MRKNIIFPVAVALFIISACNQSPKESNTEVDASVQTKKCYVAVFNTDSATLSIEEQNNRVVGELAFNFKEKDNTNGAISGEFIGDTLFTEYTYEYKGVKHSNPQVFLKKGDQLVQGHGEMRTTLGRTYFENHSEIVFDAFVFEPTDCQ